MGNNPNVIPFEPFIAAPISMILASWGEFNEAERQDGLLGRQTKLLALASSLTSAAQTEALRTALSSVDPHAVTALGMIDEVLRNAFPTLLERCRAENLSGSWRALLHDANLAAGLADACSMRPELARACVLLAGARSGLGDKAGTIQAYDWAIHAADPHGDELLRAAIHERMGSALSDAFRLDEAFEHYEAARALQTDGKALQRLLVKEAGVLTLLGEYRSAGQKLLAQITQMKAEGTAGIELAVNLDIAAQAVVGTGESAIAIKMLEEARLLFPVDALKDRAINSLIYARVLVDSGNSVGGAIAFEQAHDLSLALAQRDIVPDHYRKGFGAALATSVPADDEAILLFNQGVAAKLADQPGTAFEKWQMAVNRASSQKDARLRLRIGANVAALYSDLGMVDRAAEVAAQVSGDAQASGLARPELMALATLGSLVSSGADISETGGPLALLTRATVLLEMHTGLMKEFNLSPGVRRFETEDTGQIANELALLSETFCSSNLATEYFQSAIEKARACHSDTLLINRLAGLVSVRMRTGDLTHAIQAGDEIRTLINTGKVSARGLLAGYRALAEQDKYSDPQSAISNSRQACEVMEAMRRAIPLGPNRADFDREFYDIPGRLAGLLRRNDQPEAAFDALQRGKARRMIDALAINNSSPDSSENADAPLTAHEARGLLARAGVKTVLVDLAVEKEGVAAYVIDALLVRVVYVAGDLSEFEKMQEGDVREREARMVSLCLNSKLLGSLAKAVTALVPAGSSLMIVADRFLHNLPLHAIPVGGKSWAEQMPITYAPTAAILRFDQPAAQHGGALVAGDSRGDLKGAAEECVLVGAALASTPLTGQQCTRAAIEKALREDHPAIVHLALHGRGDARFGNRSSVLLADGNGGVEWLDFTSLTQFPWTARLVVFSGCSTGVLGLRHGTQLLSVANAALEAGASTVIASLWPVDDAYAKSFMEVFYGQFAIARASGPVDLRQLLEKARESVQKEVHTTTQSGRRDGRHFGGTSAGQSQSVKDPKVVEALAWAPFCLFGSPILNI